MSLLKPPKYPMNGTEAEKNRWPRLHMQWAMRIASLPHERKMAILGPILEEEGRRTREYLTEAVYDAGLPDDHPASIISGLINSVDHPDKLAHYLIESERLINKGRG